MLRALLPLHLGPGLLRASAARARGARLGLGLGLGLGLPALGPGLRLQGLRGAFPRGSKYPTFKDFGLTIGARVLKSWVLGPSGFRIPRSV